MTMQRSEATRGAGMFGRCHAVVVAVAIGLSCCTASASAAAFGPAVPLGPGSDEVAATDDAGRTTVAWVRRGGDVTMPDIAWSTLSLHGRWSPAKSLPDTVGHGAPGGGWFMTFDVAVAVAPNGHTLLAWGTPNGAIEAAVRPAGAASFAAPVVLVAAGGLPAGLTAAIGSDGTGIVAWTKVGLGSSSVRVSTVSGGHFSDVVEVQPDGAVAGSDPAVAVDGAGTALVLFTTEDAPESEHVVLARGKDGTWSRAEIGTAKDRKNSFSDTVSIAASRTGRFVATWPTPTGISAALGTATAGVDAGGAVSLTSSTDAGVPGAFIDAAGRAMVIWRTGAAAAPAGQPFGPAFALPGDATTTLSGAAFASDTLLDVTHTGDGKLQQRLATTATGTPSWPDAVTFASVGGEYEARPVLAESGNAVLLWTRFALSSDAVASGVFARSTIPDRAAPLLDAPRSVSLVARSRSSIDLHVGCPVGEIRCFGTVQLRAGKGPTSPLLGSVKYSIPGASDRTVRVMLNRRGQRALAARANVFARWRVRDPAGNQQVFVRHHRLLFVD